MSEASIYVIFRLPVRSFFVVSKIIALVFFFSKVCSSLTSEVKFNTQLKKISKGEIHTVVPRSSMQLSAVCYDYCRLYFAIWILISV
jgi:hypothetical protein